MYNIYIYIYTGHFYTCRDKTYRTKSSASYQSVMLVFGRYLVRISAFCYIGYPVWGLSLFRLIPPFHRTFRFKQRNTPRSSNLHRSCLTVTCTYDVDTYNTTYKPVEYIKFVPVGLHMTVAPGIIQSKATHLKRVFTTEVMWRRMSWEHYCE
jgi:hypothetical protein